METVLLGWRRLVELVVLNLLLILSLLRGMYALQEFRELVAEATGIVLPADHILLLLRNSCLII